MATFGTFTSGQTLTAAELNTAGEWSSYTPTWTQSVAITKTVNWARYTVLNKLVIGSIKMTATGAGTANNKILVGLPVSASANNFIMGSSVRFDSGATIDFRYITNSVLFESATTVGFVADEAGANQVFGQMQDDQRLGQNFTNTGGGTSTGYTVASGDIFYIQFMYEAA